MLIAEACVETGRPGRYLVQLCKHFSAKGRHIGQRLHGRRGADPQALRDMRAVAAQAEVTWSDSEGELRLPWGRITLKAEPEALAVRVESAEAQDLRRLQGLVAGHIERFGRREGLTVAWQGAANTGTPPEAGTAVRRSRRPLPALALVAAVALVLALHLGIGGAVLSNWRWTGWAAVGVLALVLLKVVVLGGFAVHRLRPRTRR